MLLKRQVWIRRICKEMWLSFLCFSNIYKVPFLEPVFGILLNNNIINTIHSGRDSIWSNALVVNILSNCDKSKIFLIYYNKNVSTTKASFLYWKCITIQVFTNLQPNCSFGKIFCNFNFKYSEYEINCNPGIYSRVASAVWLKPLE